MNNIIVNPLKSLAQKFCFSILIILMCAGNTFAQEQHVLFTDVLNIYVKDGKVDYQNLKDDFRFETYLEQLTSTNPNKISNDADRMAFWINAYNAFTLKLIVENYPLKSISELHRGGLIIGMITKSTVWQMEKFLINGEEYTLDFIEHKILRKKFKDPRIHFAIVCAANGCPPLREEAYEGATLNAQLNDQGKRFLSQREKNFFDFKQNKAFLSPIFKWFKKDFGKNQKERLLYLSQFLHPESAEELESFVDTWKIKYTHYDWKLNEW